jgi:hypothetical protein
MPTTAKPVPFEIPDAMWQRVCRNSDITEDHWVWTEHARNFWWDGNYWSPSRIAWRAFVGDPGNDELIVMCGVPRCFRPGHRVKAPRSTASGRALQSTATQAATVAKLARTHCKNGHEWSKENTRTTRGFRECRVCDVERYHKAVYGTL